jgi:hypothetical protein
MNKDEALDLALEALEETLKTLDDANAIPGGPIADTIWYSPYETLFDYLEAQITAIKQARSAPEQEPVAWTVSGKITDWSKDFSAYQTKHYTRPVYTQPAAQRQWVGLTDEDWQEIADKTDWIIWSEVRQAIEAKLKEKNGWYRQHVTDGSPCWCEPEISYTNPETGASVIVHKEPQ